MSEPVEAVPCATVINVIGSLTVRCGHVEARHLPDGGAHPCLDCVACRGFTSGEPVEAVEPRRRMTVLGPCGFAAPTLPLRCEGCGRRVRCVYIVDDGGWTFFLGRRCFARVAELLS